MSSWATSSRSSASPPPIRSFRRNGRFAEMVQAEVAGRFEAPIYGMLAVEDEIAKLDWGKAGPPAIHYHGQPLDEFASRRCCGTASGR